MTDAEEWRPVAGYEGIYEVSSRGRVRSLPRVDSRGRRNRGRYLAVINHPSGHKQVKLSREGTSKPGKLHRIVLIAFMGPPPPGCEVLHGDGDPGNNALSNLRWGTRSENLRDAVRHGTHYWAIKTHCPQRHPYDDENTYRASDGRRMCRECLRIRNREARAKKKAS